MFSHKSYLKLDDTSGGDIMSLIKEGYEIARCDFSFQQGIDDVGKASTAVIGGIIFLTLPMLPPNPIVEWAINPHKYKKGVIVVLDEENVPQEKIIFENAACTSMNIDYTLKGEAYTFTALTLHAERLTVGSGLDFDNNWIK